MKNLKAVSLLTLALSLSAPMLLAPQSAFAQGALTCRDRFASEPRVRTEKLEAISKYHRIKERGDLAHAISEFEVNVLLNDQDLPLFSERFEKVLDAMESSGSALTTALFFDKTREVLRQEGLPENLIEAGITNFRAGEISSLYRLLGNLSLAETRLMYMGHEHGVSYTADSLLGKYIAETGASTRVMPIKDVLTNKPFTEERLVVAVSAASFPAFMKYFSGRTMMSVFGHAAIFNGGMGYPHGGGKTELRAMTPLTPLPMVILKTSEAERIHRYLELGGSDEYRGWTHALKQPWLLKNEAGETYAAQGGYSCCTHFVGNMPIGDKMVSEYLLPSRAVYNYGAPNQAVETPEPAKKKLVAWKDANHPELKQVWKVPGHEQFSSVIGQLDKNVEGEFASPGYVIQTLMGPTTNDRVPVVFLFLEDHQSPVPEEPVLRFERPN